MVKYEFIGKSLLIESGEGRKRILAVGDLHLGFEEALNASGILVTRVMFREIISDFEKVFEKIGFVDEVVLLGDIKHNFGRISGQEWREALELIDYLRGKCRKIVVIKGNHDVILKPIMKKKGISVRDFYVWKGFCFSHGDEDYERIWSKDVKYLIIGHGHPALTLREGRRSEKYKCFLVGVFRGKRVVILPSFGEWNMGSDPRDGGMVFAWKMNLNEFDVKVVDSEGLGVLDFGKLGKIRE